MWSAAGNNFTKWIAYLLMAWFLTLPFGSQIGSLSLGFMTLYPNLVIGCAIFILTIISFRNWAFREKGFFFFLLVWLIFAFLQSTITHTVHAEAIFDLRSLGMQLLVAGIIFGSRSRLGNDRFFSILKTGISVYLVLLFVTGCIEWFTTSHFAGKSTETLYNLSASNSMMRAPMFLYDNTNDFLLHIIFFYLLLLVLLKKMRENTFLVLGGWLLIFVFATYGESKFASFISLTALTGQSVYFLIVKLRQYNLQKILPFALCFLFFGIAILINPLFIGPKYEHGENYRLNDMVVLKDSNSHYFPMQLKEVMNNKEQKMVVSDLDSIIMTSPDRAENLRKNLLMNGCKFISSAPVFGIGAGNYRLLSRTDKTLKYTGTIDSAHCFPIEIISQFGVFGWTYHLIILALFIDFVRKKRMNLKKMNWLLFFFIFLPLLWCMPSSYLYLEIHRLLVPVLLALIYAHNQVDRKEDVTEG